VLPGNGDGTFQAPINYSVGRKPKACMYRFGMPSILPQSMPRVRGLTIAARYRRAAILQRGVPS